MSHVRFLGKILVAALISIALLSSLNIQQVQAQTISYPSKGQISYPSVPNIYRPWTPKEAIIPTWISLANQHNGSYESIGKASGPQGWGIVAFRFGNNSKPAIMVDAQLHGNEQYGYEVMFALANWLVSGDVAANRILENNSVIFVPVADYRWDRVNYNGVDLNRNFAPSWNKTFTDSAKEFNAGATADSEPESKALISAWNRFQPRIYWDLHQGSTRVYSDGRATTTQQLSDLTQLKKILPDIASSLEVKGSLINNFYLNTTFGSGYSGLGKGFAIDGASSHGVAGVMTEVKGGWNYTDSVRQDLNSGVTFKQAKVLFIAMAQSIETTNAAPAPTVSLSLLWNISILLAIVSSSLILASELLSPYYGRVNQINKRNLQRIAMVFAILFGATMVVRVISVLLRFG